MTATIQLDTTSISQLKAALVQKRDERADEKLTELVDMFDSLNDTERGMLAAFILILEDVAFEDPSVSQQHYELSMVGFEQFRSFNEGFPPGRRIFALMGCKLAGLDTDRIAARPH